MISRPPSRPVVLGGGMAGIAAAVALARDGRRPILIESRPYLGGRTRSFIHRGTGDEIDNGQHLMMGCYRATFHLLSLLGTLPLVQLQPALRVEFRDPDGRPAVLEAPQGLPSPLDVLIGMLRLGGFNLREQLALLRPGLGALLGRISPEETVREYLDRLGQSPRLQQRLWEPIIIATLNTPPNRASARLFAEVMRRAFLGRRNDSRLAFPGPGLSRLIDPAHEYIERLGGTVMIGTPATSIERGQQGFIVRLKEEAPVQTATLIAALPWRALESIASQELVDAIRPAPGPEHEYAPIVSLYLWYDRDPADLPAFAALLGTSVQWMFNRRKLGTPPNAAFPGLLSCTISAAYTESTMTEQEMLALADRELRAAFPELQSARMMDGLVIREKHATFAATPEVEMRRPGSRTAIPGFHIAGDWTATGLPATIEGAVQSGFEAAEIVGRLCLDKGYELLSAGSGIGS